MKQIKQNAGVLTVLKPLVISEKEKRKSPGGAYIEIPKDILEVMDNPLENKNSDKLKENEDEIRKTSMNEMMEKLPGRTTLSARRGLYY